MKHWFKRPSTRVGMYLGSQQTWIAAVDALGDGLKVTHLATKPTVTPELLGTTLKSWEDALGNKNTTLVLPNEFCDQFSVDAPPVSDKELRAAAPWAIRELISYPIDDAVVDAFIIPTLNEAKAKPQMQATAIRRSIVEKLCDAFQKAHVGISAIDIEMLALRNLTTLLGEFTRPIGVLFDLQDRALLLVLHESQIYLHRELKFSSEQPTNFSLNMDSDFSFADNHSKSEDIALDIQRVFDYFQNQFRSGTVSELHIIAANTSEQEFYTELNGIIGVSVQFHPLSELFAELPLDNPDFGAMFALGAALREAS